MLTIEELMSIEKSELQEASKAIDRNELSGLVELLTEKDDKIRYQALLLLQSRSLFSNDLYQFWDIFRSKLKNENSYQRSIGLMMIAANAKWDTDNRLDDTIDDYLNLLNDDKPITIRQCIQGLQSIVPYKCHLHQKIGSKLMSVNIPDLKETMQKLILIDILDVLVLIRKHKKTDEMEGYIFNALAGGLLDKKAKKKIEAML